MANPDLLTKLLRSQVKTDEDAREFEKQYSCKLKKRKYRYGEVYTIDRGITQRFDKKLEKSFPITLYISKKKLEFLESKFTDRKRMISYIRQVVENEIEGFMNQEKIVKKFKNLKATDLSENSKEIKSRGRPRKIIEDPMEEKAIYQSIIEFANEDRISPTDFEED